MGGADGLDAGPGEIEGAVERGERSSLEDEAGARRSGHLEAVAEESEARDVRRAADAVLDEHLGPDSVERPHLIHCRREVGVRRPALSSPADEQAGPERFRQQQHVPRAGAALPQQAIRMRHADHREAIFRLGIADRVAAGKDAPSFPNLVRGAVQDGPELLGGKILGNGGDRQREQDPAAHREDVGQGIGGRDLAVRAGVVDDRRKEVQRADHGEVRRDQVDRRVVRRVEAGDQSVGGSGRVARLRDPQAGQRFGQDVRAELRGTAAALGQLGQPNR